MTNATDGQFFVSELADGRFVAAAVSAPFFCFRADSEEAVIAKVRDALNFSKSRTAETRAKVGIKSLSQTITTLRPSRRVSFNELMEAA